MTVLLTRVFFLLFIFIFSPLPVRAEEANAIVLKSDKIRAPTGSYQFDATIIRFDGEKKTAENGYRIYVRDLDHVLAEFRSPASERGKSLLMLGNNLWIYLPRVKKPIRIPLQQRLLGDVSNGDMTRANFAVDYNSTLVGEEMVGNQLCFVLDLVAKSDKKTYHRIKYWVSKSNYRPVKAEFFTVSGKSLKTSYFEDFQVAAGEVRPLRLVFQDSLHPHKRSVLVYRNMVRKQLIPRMFTKEYMKTLE